MSRRLCRRRIYPIRDSRNNEDLVCHVGNSAIVFEVMCEGRKMAMRVYIRPHKNLKAIYGENYYPKELLVNAGGDMCGMADVVLCDWYEGVSLQTKIEQLYKNQQKSILLSQMFEEFALTLLNERWAHGDLKPENIIFSTDGLHLIDFDAVYREGFMADDCVEIGTRQYQHPLRDKTNFDKSIDDYPIALITTVLAAIAIDGSLGREVAESDYLLVQPHLAVAGEDKMLERIENLFAERGDIRHYRIARLLRSQHYALPHLKMLLEAKPCIVADDAELSLESYNGYWGFADRGRFVIPPIYDLAFEFSEGFALVRIGDVWHFIDRRGEPVINCGRGVGIKPFKGGVSRISRDDGDFTIYSDGRIERV
ncbi:MAG: WG repeat-containing protein [Alistipes sp.]|nr:WG repeat-containing protein [Alistipes sp.]